jgi:putative sigma-54 modulation protein
MQVQITGRHMELTRALKSRAAKELSQFERYFENIVYVHLIFAEEKVGHSATLEVKVYGDVLTTTAKGENAFAALELVTDKMKRRLRDFKARLKERKRRASPTQQAVERMRPPEDEV